MPVDDVGLRPELITPWRSREVRTDGARRRRRARSCAIRVGPALLDAPFDAVCFRSFRRGGIGKARGTQKSSI